MRAAVTHSASFLTWPKHFCHAGFVVLFLLSFLNHDERSVPHSPLHHRLGSPAPPQEPLPATATAMASSERNLSPIIDD